MVQVFCALMSQSQHIFTHLNSPALLHGLLPIMHSQGWIAGLAGGPSTALLQSIAQAPTTGWVNPQQQPESR